MGTAYVPESAATSLVGYTYTDGEGTGWFSADDGDWHDFGAFTLGDGYGEPAFTVDTDGGGHQRLNFHPTDGTSLYVVEYDVTLSVGSTLDGTFPVGETFMVQLGNVPASNGFGNDGVTHPFVIPSNDTVGHAPTHLNPIASTQRHVRQVFVGNAQTTHLPFVAKVWSEGVLVLTDADPITYAEQGAGRDVNVTLQFTNIQRFLVPEQQ